MKLLEKSSDALFISFGPLCCLLLMCKTVLFPGCSDRTAQTYQVAVFESHELLDAFVSVYRVVVGEDTLAVSSGLWIVSLRLHVTSNAESIQPTSTEHFETAWANRWIGRVFGCIVFSLNIKNKKNTKKKKNYSACSGGCGIQVIINFALK